MAMTLERFDNLLLVHGADLERWPAADRRAAQALVDDSRAARDMLAGARAFEAQLAEALAAEPLGSALTGRILAHVQANAQSLAGGGMMAITRGWRVAFGSAVTAAIVLGFAAGVAVDGASLLGLEYAGDMLVFIDQPADIADLL